MLRAIATLPLLLMLPFSIWAQNTGIYITNGAGIVTSGASSILITNGGFVNNGVFTASSENNFIMNGNSAQIIGGTASTTFNNLTVNNTAGVTVDGQMASVRNILLCNGLLNANGKLTLLSTADGTALIDGSGTGEVTGNLTMERYLPSAFGYKYFSSPFQTSAVSEFSDESIEAIYRHDENRLEGGLPASGWIDYYSDANILVPLSGYAINFGFDTTETTVDVTGVVNNGFMSVPVYNNDHIYTRGINLCGNPYPSPVDWNKIKLLNTNVDDAVYYFKSSSTDQYDGVYCTYINGVSSDGVASNIIASMQGFFVHVTNGAFPVSGTLAMNNSVRTTGQPVFYAKSASKASGQLIRLSATYADTPNNADFAVVYFDDKATENFDGTLDALKLMNSDSQVPSIYSVTADAKNLSINGLPVATGTNRTIPLGLKLVRDGNIVFRTTELGSDLQYMKVTLTDNLTGTIHDLLPGKEYSVFLTEGVYSGRFFINLSETLTDVPAISSGEVFTVFASNGILKTEINAISGDKGALTIYNLSGQALLVKNVYATGHYELTTNLTNGVYIVSYYTGTTRNSKKVVIMN